MISPIQRTLFQSLTSILKRTMARGWGGGRVNCGRVHAIFNQEITPSEPHPILILFDLLHCYKKLIHAVGDHHRPRKNARSLATSTYLSQSRYMRKMTLCINHLYNCLTSDQSDRKNQTDAECHVNHPPPPPSTSRRSYVPNRIQAEFLRKIKQLLIRTVFACVSIRWK